MTTHAPIHPGEVLREDILIPLGLSEYRVAKDIGVPPRRIPPFFSASGPALVFIHKSGPLFRGVQGSVKISEINSAYVRGGRLN